MEKIQSIVFEKLANGRVGSLGDSLELLPLMEKDEKYIIEVIHHISYPDPMVGLRACNCLYKLGMNIPNHFKLFKNCILDQLNHLLTIPVLLPIDFPKLLVFFEFSTQELVIIFEGLFKFYDSNCHTFSKVNCLDTLTELSIKYKYECDSIDQILEHEIVHAEKASIKARCRKLKSKIEKLIMERNA